MVIRTRLVALLMFMTGGCAAMLPDKMLNSWLGHTEHELIVAWGPPTKVDDDGAGGKVLTYVITDTYVNPFGRNAYYSTDANGNVVYHPATNAPQTDLKVRRFYVDPSGRIYRWWYQGI